MPPDLLANVSGPEWELATCGNDYVVWIREGDRSAEGDAYDGPPNEEGGCLLGPR